MPDDLTDDQIALLCHIGEFDLSKQIEDRKRDLERGERGGGLNEAYSTVPLPRHSCGEARGVVAGDGNGPNSLSGALLTRGLRAMPRSWPASAQFIATHLMRL